MTHYDCMMILLYFLSLEGECFSIVHLAACAPCLYSMLPWSHHNTRQTWLNWCFPYVINLPLWCFNLFYYKVERKQQTMGKSSKYVGPWIMNNIYVIFICFYNVPRVVHIIHNTTLLFHCNMYMLGKSNSGSNYNNFMFVRDFNDLILEMK
jgi:hypothetical protein